MRTLRLPAPLQAAAFAGTPNLLVMACAGGRALLWKRGSLIHSFATGARQCQQRRTRQAGILLAITQADIFLLPARLVSSIHPALMSSSQLGTVTLAWSETAYLTLIHPFATGARPCEIVVDPVLTTDDTM